MVLPVLFLVSEVSMSGKPQLYRVNPTTREPAALQEVDLGQLGLRERSDLQEWIANNPGIVGDELLIIAKEFDRFDRTRERLEQLTLAADLS